MHILRTKLNRPLLRSKWVQRSRLIARLDEGLSMRVTLICTPAGFGKTTLAVQWLDRVHRPSVWLSLDKNDSDPVRFLRYVVAAIQTAAPDYGSRMVTALSSPHFPPLEYLADIIISELTELEKPLVIVFDDYHTIVSDEVQKIVSRIVQHLPENIHLLISTRMDPPWSMARWRLQQWLNELRAADLSFTPEESRTFFRNSSLTAEAIDMLQKRSEGWIAGLQLALLSLANADDPEQFVRHFSESDCLIVDYLMEEVISRQPKDVLEFLSVTALFDSFCAPLFDFLLADAHSSQSSDKVIARMKKSGDTIPFSS